jgi:hypothetical protein
LFLLLVSLPVFSQTTKSSEFAKCPEAKILADLLLQTELLGWRNPHAKESCLNGNLFKFLKKQKIEYVDNIPKQQDILKVAEKDLPSVKVTSLVKTDLSNTFTVGFEYLAVNSKGKKQKVVDSFDMIIHNKANRELLGCAGITASPRQLFSKESCFIK